AKSVVLSGGGGVLGLREANQFVELRARGARVNRFRCETHAIEEVGCATSGNESGGSIRQHDVAMRAVLAVKHSAAEDFMNDFGVMFGVAAANRLGRCTAQSEIFGHDCIAPNHAIVQFRNVSLSAQRNLVHSIGAVNDEGPPHSEFIESAGEKFSEVRV